MNQSLRNQVDRTRAALERFQKRSPAGGDVAEMQQITRELVREVQALLEQFDRGATSKAA